MGREVNLLDAYPSAKRSFDDRFSSITVADRIAARYFGREYFDGTRNQGYGGYSYHPRFWQPVVKRLQAYYRLSAKSRVLDVGCGKGFLLHDLKELIPQITVAGVDISEYAINSALDDVKPFIQIGNAKKLPFADGTFDLVLSINTIHNLPIEDCLPALSEIERVSQKHKFIVVDAWRTEEEKQRMAKWVITGITCLSTKDWKELFKLAGYSGDFYWFIV
ncbi:class I SAM-dependent methyltransferase [Candidatus Daviesbacteria bacterium]|nr:class I SAM-dependent methyltransferase [Candidatus Daviesbacteria bacterium]